MVVVVVASGGIGGGGGGGGCDDGDEDAEDDDGEADDDVGGGTMLRLSGAPKGTGGGMDTTPEPLRGPIDDAPDDDELTDTADGWCGGGGGNSP